MTDRDLIRAAGSGDQGTFAVLAGRALPRLDAAARLVLRDHGLAQVAVQEALVLA